MVLSLRRVLRGLLFAALFLLLVFAISELFRLAAEWLRMPEARALPEGRAVKVFLLEPDAHDAPSVLDRLRLFWLAGG